MNVSTDQRLADRVLQAETILERLRGLLGRSSLPEGEAMLLEPCRAIHTVGMRFPIDVLFLDGGGRVVRAAERIRPNRLMEAAWRAKRALKLPAGRIAATGTSVGHQVHLQTGSGTDRRSQGRRWALDLSLFLLFAALAAANLLNFLSSPTLGGAGVFLVNALASLLFLLRREAHRVTKLGTDWALTLSILVIPWSLRAGAPSAGVPFLSGHLFQGLGLLLVLASLFRLGRSFGLTPADRGLVHRGPYRWIRHPMYTGELLFYLGFGLVNPSPWNLVVLGGLFFGLPLRALAEERLLGSDPRYVTYRGQVPSRFLPLVL